MPSSTANLVLAPDSAIDLQLHTTFSDGQWEPEALIDYLAAEGFGLAAITDHERVDSYASLQALALQKRLPVLPAVEMTASWNGGSVDVLCFGFDPDSSALAGLSDDIMQRQLENTREAYENLRRQGYPLSQEPDELSAILATPSGQQTIELADLLEKLGCGTPEKSAWRIVMEAGGCFVANDIALVVESGHRSGAVCLIAHPGRGGANTVFDAGMLDRLRADAPIDGIEAYYPRHTPAQVEMFLEYARKHRLLTSSGSDSHGPDHKPIKYRADLSRALLERVGVRVR